jgi:hypothetical protein
MNSKTVNINNGRVRPVTASVWKAWFRQVGHDCHGCNRKVLGVALLGKVHGLRKQRVAPEVRENSWEFELLAFAVMTQEWVINCFRKLG